MQNARARASSAHASLTILLCLQGPFACKEVGVLIIEDLDERGLEGDLGATGVAELLCLVQQLVRGAREHAPRDLLDGCEVGLYLRIGEVA